MRETNESKRIFRIAAAERDMIRKNYQRKQKSLIKIEKINKQI